MRNKLLISTLLVAASCSAVDLPVVADVHAGPSTAQAGALPNLLVGGGNKVLLRFDMGVLPAGLRPEQVVKATLVFHVSRILVAGPLQVSMLYGPFDEMTVTAATAPSSAMPIPMPVVQGLNTVDVTWMVQSWVSAPVNAFGLQLAPPPAASTSVQVDSKENIATSFAAEIRVVLAGMVGPAGPQGMPGLAGARGATGATGATGAAGQNDPQLLHAVCAALSKVSVPTGLNCPAKTVFVTAGLYGAGFGSLDRADQVCQTEASANGLTGTYKAWLSASGPPGPIPAPNGVWLLTVSQRFTPTAGQYRLVDGTLVAYNFNDLLDGQLLQPINRMPNGQVVTSSYAVWTGTTASGGSNGMDCGNWRSTSSGVAGSAGNAALSGSQWTMAVAAGCDASMRLYCIEQ